jgi:cytochrome b561
MATTPPSAPEPQASAPAAQASISPFGRVIGVFFSPKATFEDIVRKPSWVLPAAIILILSLAAVATLNQHFNWRDYMSQQMEKNSRTAQLSPEQKEQQIEAGAKYAPIAAYVSSVALPVIGILVISLVLMAAYNLMAGAGVNFGTSLAIVTHSLVPASIVGTFLFLLVLFLKPVGMFDLENPVATNLAVLLPEDSAKWLVALAKNIDLLELWKILLLAIGFAAVNPRKLKGGKSFTIVVSVFLVYVVIRVCMAFVFS